MAGPKKHEGATGREGWTSHTWHTPGRWSGDRIVRLLHAIGMSQAQLARVCHVSQSTVERWCANAAYPRPRSVADIEELLTSALRQAREREDQ